MADWQASLIYSSTLVAVFVRSENHDAIAHIADIRCVEAEAQKGIGCSDIAAQGLRNQPLDTARRDSVTTWLLRLILTLDARTALRSSPGENSSRFLRLA